MRNTADDIFTPAAVKVLGLETVEKEFFYRPSHALAARLLFKEISGRVIAEKIKMGGRIDFYQRVGVVWEPYYTIENDAVRILENMVNDTRDEMEKNADPSELPKIGLHAGKTKKTIQSRDFVRGALGFLANAVLVSPSIPWNETAETIPCEDGILDISGPEPIEREPKDGEYFRDPVPCFITEIIDDLPSLRFQDFLETLFANSETRKSALECLAACISGKPSKTFQIWTNREGDGGKNCLADLVRALVPSRAIFAKNALILFKADSGEKRFGEIEMQGRTAVFFDEVGGTFDVAAIKRYTSNSTIRGEAKGKQSVEFPQTWAMVALCNSLPRFYPADDAAFLSRLFILPFSSVFYPDDASYTRRIDEGVDPMRLKPAADKKALIDSLLQDRGAIIGQLARVWIEMRMNNGKPYEAPECRVAKKVYQTDNDITEGFFSEYLRRDDTGKVSYDDLKTAWAEFTGEVKPSMKNLIQNLTSRYKFIAPIKSHGIRMIQGVSMKENETQSIETMGDSRLEF